MEKLVELRLPVWTLDSRKGQQGRVMVVGGSPECYGAPILACMGAEAAGADLVGAVMPTEHLEAAKRCSLNLFLYGFNGKILSCADVNNIIAISEKYDVLVIGNGIGKSFESRDAVLEILERVDMPIVLDAEALIPEILDIRAAKNKQSWLLTPHHTEFKKLFSQEINLKNIHKLAEKHSITLCVKGMIDYVASPDFFYENRTGVPQMRIGGTGDALAGIMGAYYSMGMDPFNAAKTAIFFWGRCGEVMMQKSYTLSASAMLRYYPKLVLKIIKLAAERGESGDFCNTIVASNMMYN